MFLNSTLKKCTILMVLSLSACVAPTDPSTTQQSTVVSAANDAPALAATQTIVENDPIVNARFSGGGTTWVTGEKIIFRYTAIERNGEVYICGAYTARGSNTIRKLSREVMRQATVSADGQTIMRNLRFFTEASNANFASELVGVETNCRSTGLTVGTVPMGRVIVRTRDGNYRIRL